MFQSLPFGQMQKFTGTTRVNYGKKHFLRVRPSGYLTLYKHEFTDYKCVPHFDSNLYLKRTPETQFTHIPTDNRIRQKNRDLL